MTILQFDIILVLEIKKENKKAWKKRKDNLEIVEGCKFIHFLSILAFRSEKRGW